MSFLSWLRKRTANRSRRRDAFQKRPTPRRFQPHLEALEDRWVPSTLKVTGNGDSGRGTLRYEIAQAQSNDTIVFDFGNKKANSTPHTITLTSGELDINKNLTIQGPGAGLLTITSFGLTNIGQPFNDSSRIFEVERGVHATLSGMTISNGDAFRFFNAFSSSVTDPHDGTGGGVLNLGTLTISGCTLTNNFAGSYGSVGGAGGGGGIANLGTLTVSNCALSNNSTYGNGGGIYNEANCTLTVSGGSISDNTALSGGGVGNFGTMTVSGCTVPGNTADPATGTNTGFAIANGGGGILNMGTLTVSNSTFSGNTPDNIAGPYTDGDGNTFS